MLLDELMPEYDVVERHAHDIDAPPQRVYEALRAIDFGSSPVIRGLWWLRSMGTEKAMTWDALLRFGFVTVADDPPRELVLGLIAQPWRLDGGIQHPSADEWRAFDRDGFAKIAWSFSTDELVGGGARSGPMTALATETRVRVRDEASRRKFRWYWRAIGPFSAWIRRETLRLVAAACTIALVVACAQPPSVAIDGPWTHATGNPDLGALTSPMQQPVDFSIYQSADGTWHIWECIRFTLVAGNTRLFYHWHAASPLGPWTADGIAMEADPTVGEIAGGLQAPYVFREADRFHMFYGAWESICSQTSTDGVTFERVLDADGQCPLFSEGAMTNTRDPMVVRDGDRWIAYYTAMIFDPGGVHGAVFARTSRDLVAWSDRVIVAFGGIAGVGGSSGECPFVVHRASGYYLFRTHLYGVAPFTEVYRSDDPLAFGIEDDADHVATLPVAAPEIFEWNGDTYIAALELDTQGIRIAKLAFGE